MWLVNQQSLVFGADETQQSYGTGWTATVQKQGDMQLQQVIARNTEHRVYAETKMETTKTKQYKQWEALEAHLAGFAVMETYCGHIV